MGGCRCTYRNCTVKSDGVTHMFHYPVFDKVRCHQWLTNAHRLEFLNLNVSQLKNRVVCQHHFKEECFMNCLKARLTFSAVPTEDGPFCDSSQLPENYSLPEVAKVTRDYIENEYLGKTEKQANSSVKYGDFLTNCEVMDMVTNCEVMDMVNLDAANIVKNDHDIYHSLKFDSNLDNKYLKSDKTISNNKKYKEITVILPNSEAMVVGFEYDKSLQNTENQKQVTNQTTIDIKPNSKKINIISEKAITEPIKVGQLIPVSPSIIIEPPEKREKNILPNIVVEQRTEEPQNIIENKVCKEVKDRAVQEKITIPNTTSKINQIDTIAIHETTPIQQVPPIDQAVSAENLQRQTTRAVKAKVCLPSASNLKSKIAPERVAIIEEKRKFNMKLRDIIESCLKNLDDNDKDVSYMNMNKKVKETKGDKNVSSQKSMPLKEPECNMALLEARLKRMEDTLLNKINQNSERINELKDSLSSTHYSRKVVHTMKDEEAHKRKLYQEISQYLSPEANSLIYEELFINKYAQKILTSRKRKKRSLVNLL